MNKKIAVSEESKSTDESEIDLSLSASQKVSHSAQNQQVQFAKENALASDGESNFVADTSAIGAMIHGANDLAAMTTVATANATSDITTPENDVQIYLHILALMKKNYCHTSIHIMQK